METLVHPYAQISNYACALNPRIRQFVPASLLVWIDQRAVITKIQFCPQQKFYTNQPMTPSHKACITLPHVILLYHYTSFPEGCVHVT